MTVVATGARRATEGPAFLLTLAALATLSACASLRGHQAPVLDRISPDSVLVAPGSVVEVVLSGSGFQAENTIHFANTALRGVAASEDGRRITFAIPDAIDAGVGAPRVQLVAGSYPVRVETSAGTSNVLVLKVTR
jgi:hypothetical protein